MTNRLLTCLILLTAACGDDELPTDTGPANDVRTSDVATDAPASDPCIAAESLVPPLSCIPATQGGIVCPGSCGQTLEGPVGVGLTTCRCVDGATGGLWECDLSACGMDGGTDAGVPLDAAMDAAMDAMDARSADECLAAYAALNSNAKCPLTITEFDFQGIICGPARMTSEDCADSLDTWLACVQTAPVVCEQFADDSVVPTTPSCTPIPNECLPKP